MSLPNREKAYVPAYALWRLLGRLQIRELDTVVLTRDVQEHGLKQGDVGAVVHRYNGGEAFEVEFVTAEGTTVALLTLTLSDIRPISDGEILHVRAFGPA